jgi:hypothetical protein
MNPVAVRKINQQTDDTVKSAALELTESRCRVCEAHRLRKWLTWLDHDMSLGIALHALEGRREVAVSNY